MLLQLNNTDKKNVDMLLSFAKQHNLQLTLVDDEEINYSLPGKPLLSSQLEKLIQKSRNSGTISLQNAHQIIRDAYKKS
jgi:hypothetical protein